MSFCKINKKALITVFVCSCIQDLSVPILSGWLKAGFLPLLVLVILAGDIALVNHASAQNDTAITDTTNVLQKRPDWYSMERYNLAGSFTYSLTDIRMNDNLKEVGTDYSGLNNKLSYLLMGSSSGWDVSNLADLSYSPWRIFSQNRFIVDAFRLEAEKGGITINAGDFYPSYSGITLEGLTLRGLGFKKIDNEKLIVQAFIAQSQQAKKPVKEDINGNFAIDAGEDVNGNNILDVKEGDFRQHMIGGRIENKFSRFFNAGVNFISAKDDVSSISDPQSVDSTSGLYPVLKNNVIGIDGHLHFLDDRLKIDSEYGKSDYLKGSGDTTFTDQASNIKLGFLSKTWMTKLIFQKIDPDYRSEGNPYLETDKKGFDCENEFILSKKYSFTGNYEKYNNNVNKLENETTTVSRQQEYKLKYDPGSVNTELKYKNLTKKGKQPDEKDTNDDTYAVTIRDEYGEETWITYNVQISKYKDILLNTNDYAGYSGYVSWNWSIKKDRLSLIPYFNYNLFKYKNLDQKQIYYLTNIQSNIVFWKNKWVLAPYLEYNYTSQNGSKVLERFSRDIELKYYLSQSVSFSFKYGKLNSNDENNSLDYSVRKIGGEVTAVF